MSAFFIQKKIFFVVIFFIILGWSISASSQQVGATLESCGASVTPNSITTSAENTFTFTINNTGSNPILFFKVTSPSASFSIQGKDAVGWSSTSNSSFAQFWGGSIPAGSSFNFTVLIQAGTSELSSSNWTIVANDVLSDSGTTTCTGSTGIAITGVADVIGPVLSELVTISNINVSSATFSWTTNENSNSVVNYGTTDSLGSTKSSETLSLSHSISLSSLSANTTYYFEIASTDAAGNTTVSDQASFTTTAEATLTVTQATSVITTVTIAATPIPTPTPPPVDTTPPRVIIETDLSTPFEIAPLITGRATDNKDVSSVEYSTDGGYNWLPVDEIESIGTSKTNYEFIPFLSEDGNYTIQVRAKDSRGNIGVSEKLTLVIDRLPPLVGGNLISLGPQPLMPNANGTLIALAGLEQKITVSAVGGPTSIDLFVGDKKIPLTYSAETGLWSGYLNLDTVGFYSMTTIAIDGAKNETTRKLNNIRVVEAGQVSNKKTGEVSTKGVVSVYTQDKDTKIWNLWDAQAFTQKNPQALDDRGNYQFFLPPGKYYLQVESAGFQTLKSQIFSIDKSRPINTNFMMEDGRALQIGPFRINLPVFMQKTLDINLTLPEIETSEKSEANMIGTLAPDFSLNLDNDQFKLSSLRGQTSIISFVNTWSPPAIEQISIINQVAKKNLLPIVMISTQENTSKVSIFRQRGNYETPIWVDPDGNLVEMYQLNTLPTHVVIDRRGQIVQVITQVLNEEELLNLLNLANDVL